MKAVMGVLTLNSTRLIYRGVFDQGFVLKVNFVLGAFDRGRFVPGLSAEWGVPVAFVPRTLL